MQQYTRKGGRERALAPKTHQESSSLSGLMSFLCLPLLLVGVASPSPSELVDDWRAAGLERCLLRRPDLMTTPPSPSLSPRATFRGVWPGLGGELLFSSLSDLIVGVLFGVLRFGTMSEPLSSSVLEVGVWQPQGEGEEEEGAW